MLGVCGSVAAYKAALVARALQRHGATVRVILTAAAGRFVTPELFAALTGEPPATDLFAPGAPEHIALAAWAEAALIAPATADVLAKAASGLADDYLSTWLLAFPGPVLFAPAMNQWMWAHPAVQRNVRRLEADGARLLPPAHGALAAAAEGEGWGRLPGPESLVSALEAEMPPVGARRRPLAPPPSRDLAGRRVVVTAGPTREPIDPVRFLSNPSSGRMGYAVAEAARDRGAAVTLVSGPVSLPAPAGVAFEAVQTALEMRAAVQRVAVGADLVVAAAAPADWRPAEVSSTKKKKGGATTATLELVANPDILAELGAERGGRVLVGFAAEAGAGLEEARRKLQAKRLHLIAYNDVRQAGAGFGGDSNRVVLLDRDGGAEDLGPLSKREVADRILDRARLYLSADPVAAPAEPNANGG